MDTSAQPQSPAAASAAAPAAASPTAPAAASAAAPAPAHGQTKGEEHSDPRTVAQLYGAGMPVSFEIFPPKGDLTLDDARTLSDQLAPLGPAFVSVTCSAGGSGNKGATCAVASLIQQRHGVPTVAHLTCQGLTREGLARASQEMRDAGVRNVLALRGDPVPGVEPGDFAFAKDLIGPLVQEGFCVGAAAYPEGHVACLDLDEDVRRLRQKQDAGASFLVTQLFFDNQVALRFLDRCRRAGVTAPISFGVMPFLSKAQVQRMVFMCGASLPSQVVKLLARYEDDPAALRQAGIAYACEQLRGLAAEGVDGLHVYTMNQPEVAAACTQALGLGARA